MQRLYSTFPGRWPGVGLLLLRTAVGVWAAIEGGAHLLGVGGTSVGATAASVGSSATVSGEPSWWILACATVVVISGLALLIGFLTPVAGFVIALSSGARALSWIPPPAPHLNDTHASAWFMLIVAAGVVLLGPGAFSLDSYLFGRREIIIPPSPDPQAHRVHE